jgi:hypothetical protein
MTVGGHVIPDGFGYRVRAGKDLSNTEACMGMAGDIQELLDNLLWLYSAPPGE